jgi:hypothetical protein
MRDEAPVAYSTKKENPKWLSYVRVPPFCLSSRTCIQPSNTRSLSGSFLEPKPMLLCLMFDPTLSNLKMFYKHTPKCFMFLDKPNCYHRDTRKRPENSEIHLVAVCLSRSTTTTLKNRLRFQTQHVNFHRFNICPTERCKIVRCSKAQHATSCSRTSRTVVTKTRIKPLKGQVNGV